MGLKSLADDTINFLFKTRIYSLIRTSLKKVCHKRIQKKKHFLNTKSPCPNTELLSEKNRRQTFQEI